MENKVKAIGKSIVAIGFAPEPNKITIVGSGFCVAEGGKVLSAAHLYNQLKPDQVNTLRAMVMTKKESGLEHFVWLPIKLVKKEDKLDLVTFQIEGSEETLLKPLKLGDSDNVEVGQDVYFIGFPYAAQLMNDGFGVTRIINRGIISNVKRDGQDPSHPLNWFIVDAISNLGNSGCPLIDVKNNKVIGVMTIAFRMKSQTSPDLDIREPMHIAGAKPINLAKRLLVETV